MSLSAAPLRWEASSRAAEAAEEPLRGEPFGLEHLEQHAEQLVLPLSPSAGGGALRQFTARIAANAELLRRARRVAAASARQQGVLTSDAEWLLDNFNVVEEQLREISDDLPPRFFRELPKLASGQPRVYALAIELIVHTDSALDEQTILRFVKAFQRHTPLSIGEVWAFPIMLRLGLVENLRRLAAQMLAVRDCQACAADLIKGWCASGECRLDLSSAERCAPLVLELIEQIQELGADHAHRLDELERRITAQGHATADVMRLAHQQQASNQVSIGNVITSMRLISALDWMAFFEEANLAEQVLRRDPAEVYTRMDSATRDKYRHVVERYAKRTKLTDVEVAERAIDLARNARDRGNSADEKCHVGYYLLDEGLPQLVAALHARPRLSERWERRLRPFAAHLFVACLAGLTALGAATVAALTLGAGGSVAAAMIMSGLALFPASELAVAFVNLVVTMRWPPRILPKLDFKEGVPESCGAIVVVPSLLTNQAEIESLVQRLELHYLANTEPHLRFALLTDFTDAQTATLPADEPLLECARRRIRALNYKYGRDGEGPFYLLHRARRWNESDRIWMGWERKRGKLMEFNQFLCGASNTTFEAVEGNLAALAGTRDKPSFRYVITLDADTQLPAGTAQRMIGTLAHPLNRPRFDEQNRLRGGYVILQPRIGLHLGSATRSWFSRIFANSPGIDPYATAASDVYQDLFGEGSFTGKGIYDLAAFERMLASVFPENHILSHDLIEGCHARVALTSDIELFDGYPARYDADARRQHRWVRGDWQLLPWLGPRVPTETGWRANPLSLLSYWKIIDNLRRSLAPFFALLFFLVGWLAFPALAPLWTGLGIIPFAFPTLTYLALTPRNWPRGIAWTEYRRTWSRELWRCCLQAGLLFALLPHRAVLMIDAVLRTVWRLAVTRRRLLEWETAAATERRLSQSRWTFFAQMWYSPVLAALVFVLLPNFARLCAGPLLAAWFFAPLIAHWISRPIVRQAHALADEELRWLRIVTRKTWAFFERFVTEADHWLPPDNFQEYPGEKIAHRISPTNEGLFLVSALAARDFGYVSLLDLATIWERNLAEWTRLPKLRGHFYNWYDTQTLEALRPRYVSTVDSGNLMACFLTLRQAALELPRRAIFGKPEWQGLLDSLDCLELACELSHPRGARLVNSCLEGIGVHAKELRELWGEVPGSLREWRSRLDAAEPLSARLVQLVAELATDRTFAKTNISADGQALGRRLDELRTEFDTFFPWTSLVATANLPGEAPQPWTTLVEKLESATDLAALGHLESATGEEFSSLREIWHAEPAALDLLAQLWAAVQTASGAANSLQERLASLGNWFEDLALEMDFAFLYNPQRKLFSIGFNLEEGHLDRSHYDMLASEARLAGYLAVAKGDVDHEHWFRMGRPLTEAAGQVGLLSWGGTMFEYLMPQLFHKSYEGSLLEQSCRMAVARQMEHGRRNQVPWGVSESAFGALAANSDYHYRSFGVPGLGLKRGLAKDLVISPYSTMLALDVDPHGAYENLRALSKEGGLGAWGFYDALDYSRERVPDGKRSQAVRCYMAHHQGMSLVALANLLHGGSMRRRFHSHALGRVAELLLQERVPAAVGLVQPHEEEVDDLQLPVVGEELVSRRLVGYETAAPRTHLLSNSQYSVMLTNTGGGYSQCQGLAVTRWRCDATRDCWGQFLYLRDPRTGRTWSATYQPTRARPDFYEVVYSVDKAEYHRRDGQIESRLEVAVSPENNAEVRQLTLTNHAAHAAEIEVTSYGELVLLAAAADLAHPAFHKLFVETEYIAEEMALLARRRPRDSHEAPRWAVHVLAPSDPSVQVEYETSRAAFLGRGRTLAAPRALDRGAQLGGTTGAVLDPVLALRCRVTVPAHQSATVAFTTCVATSREEALMLADQYHEPRGVQRALELAWAYSQVELRHSHLSPAKAHLYQRLAAGLLYPDRERRAPAETLLANRQGQSTLWRYGISGDVPILLAHITNPEQIDFARDLLAAHQFWRSHGMLVDLALMNDYPGSYVDALQDQLIGLINEIRHLPDEKPAGIFLLRSSQISREDQVLLESAATMLLSAEDGALAKQVEAAAHSATSPPVTEARGNGKPAPLSQGIAARDSGLEFWNGWGGFANQGREYHIESRGQRRTPLPWSNVIANPRLGCLATESGGGYTWAENSREFKLTAWSNDPIADSPSEWLYLKDETTAKVWRPLPQSCGDGEGDYRIVHGQGYSRFRHGAEEIESDVVVSIAPDDPVKFVCVSLENKSLRPRSLSLTMYVEWVLGVAREQTQLHVATQIDRETGALLARNAYHPELPGHTAFLHASGAQVSCTGDRAEFIGRNGDLLSPAALSRRALSGQTGAGLDPGGAVQSRVTLAPGGKTEVIFLLGAGADADEARALVKKYSQATEVHEAVTQTANRWNDLLGAIEVKTPNRAFDLLVNRWLLYQVVGCRLWARSAFYQAGGAYGFRDQLQDIMAVVYSRPDLARGQLLRAAARQFEEGDVQHWWHPPTGRGTRTRFSDDYLWLPLVAAHYIAVTQDRAVLDAEVGFLQSPPLEPEVHERYEQPYVSSQKGSLYEHCRRTLARAFRLGPHGLPLIGCGDWNDGFSHVGAKGQGESVWMGWFLLVILREFGPLMRARGDGAFADELAAQGETLRHALEREAWDGGWYRRAYYDDGTPLGSRESEECQIDSLAQTWAVFAGADPTRVREGMEAVWQRLVREGDKLVLLFTPPFDKSPQNPGYIKGYLPGIRENGGQYTHAALWVAQAYAMLGDAERAMAIFDLVNPIHHASTAAGVERYQVEPYVVAADVYGISPHTGRGGWTWYTGSASWMYRVALEHILGFQLRGNRLRLAPCVPASWPEFELTLRRGEATYRIVVKNEPDIDSAAAPYSINGMPLPGPEIELPTDPGQHEIVYRVPRA